MGWEGYLTGLVTPQSRLFFTFRPTLLNFCGQQAFSRARSTRVLVTLVDCGLPLQKSVPATWPVCGRTAVLCVQFSLPPVSPLLFPCCPEPICQLASTPARLLATGQYKRACVAVAKLAPSTLKVISPHASLCRGEPGRGWSSAQSTCCQTGAPAARTRRVWARLASRLRRQTFFNCWETATQRPHPGELCDCASPHTPQLSCERRLAAHNPTFHDLTGSGHVACLLPCRLQLDVDRETALSVLKERQQSSPNFIVRKSSKPNSLAISLVTSQGKIKNYLINRAGDVYVFSAST